MWACALSSPFQFVVGVLCLASIVSTLAPSATAHARCGAIGLSADVRRSAFVVEASVVRGGDPAEFRTVAVWKGSDTAPGTFTLHASYGGPLTPWPRAGTEGQVYLVMLSPGRDGLRVRRCGHSGLMNEELRAALGALGLTRMRLQN